MKRIGRFAVREGDSQDGKTALIIGGVQGNYFKSGHVYEFQEFLGEIVIKDLGESCINSSNEREVRPYETWHHEVDSLVREGSHFRITAEEYERINS